MKLQTQIPLKPEQNQIDYSSKVLSLGSCFTKNIGARLEYYKFQNLVNPFGILFHPLAIEKLVERAINENHFTENDIFFHNEHWHCFEVHSVLSEIDKEVFLKKLNSILKEFKTYLSEATHIVLTFGTAWTYKLSETNKTVANCHKIPQKKFRKKILTSEEISESIKKMAGLIQSINPTTIFIHTVSPVRHIKDGFVENMQSKAHLLTGIHAFVNRKSAIENRKSFYFPSFEIMMDELRDYRFYKADMLHPNATAISIIWEKFKTVWISSETESVQKEIGTIQNGLAHRPFNETSEAHEKFRKNLQQKIKNIRLQLPDIQF